MENNTLHFLKFFLFVSILAMIVGLHTWIIQVYKPSYFGIIGFFGVFAECLIISIIVFFGADYLIKKIYWRENGK